MVIFFYMVERTIEVFMNGFLVVGESIDNCNLRVMLVRCEETNLVLN